MRWEKTRSAFLCSSYWNFFFFFTWGKFVRIFFLLDICPRFFLLIICPPFSFHPLHQMWWTAGVFFCSRGRCVSLDSVCNSPFRFVSDEPFLSLLAKKKKKSWTNGKKVDFFFFFGSGWTGRKKKKKADGQFSPQGKELWSIFPFIQALNQSHWPVLYSQPDLVCLRRHLFD